MKKITAIILFVFVAAICLVQQVMGRCNVCNENLIACISETKFQLCFNGDRDQSQDYECPNGQICTELGLRCVDRVASGPQPACLNTGACGECNGRNMFACTSRSTFVQCNGTETIPDKTGNCPDGLTCDSNQAEICVSDCRLPATLECSNDVPLS